MISSRLAVDVPEPAAEKNPRHAPILRRRHRSGRSPMGPRWRLYRGPDHTAVDSLASADGLGLGHGLRRQLHEGHAPAGLGIALHRRTLPVLRGLRLPDPGTRQALGRGLAPLGPACARPPYPHQGRGDPCADRCGAGSALLGGAGPQHVHQSRPGLSARHVCGDPEPQLRADPCVGADSGSCHRALLPPAPPFVSRRPRAA